MSSDAQEWLLARSPNRYGVRRLRWATARGGRSWWRRPNQEINKQTALSCSRGSDWGKTDRLSHKSIGPVKLPRHNPFDSPSPTLRKKAGGDDRRRVVELLVSFDMVKGEEFVWHTITSNSAEDKASIKAERRDELAWGRLEVRFHVYETAHSLRWTF